MLRKIGCKLKVRQHRKEKKMSLTVEQTPLQSLGSAVQLKAQG